MSFTWQTCDMGSDGPVREEARRTPRQVPHIEAHVSTGAVIQYVPQCTAQAVTNNAHAICNDRRLASDAMQCNGTLLMLPASTRMRHDAVQGDGDVLGFAELAESRHSATTKHQSWIAVAVLPAEGWRPWSKSWSVISRHH
jgi:hypothetical protein